MSLLQPRFDSRRPPPAGLARHAAAFHRRWVRLRHRGAAVECPVCGRRWREFVPDWNRPGVICPGCGSQERHRALALYLDERRLLTPGTSLLHFAPEYCLERRLQRLPDMSIVTTDLDPSIADVPADIMDLPFAADSFDAVLCSHVLEHVADDRRAVRQLLRVLRPGGWALVMVPLDASRSQTLEDPRISTPEERERHYWQHDHLRLYAPADLERRLADAGFDVHVDPIEEGLPAGAVERHGLARGELIFRCVKPAPNRRKSGRGA